MKKYIVGVFTLFLIIFTFAGCSPSSTEKLASLSIIYGATAVLSLLLLFGYCLLIEKKKTWFLVLFSSVLVVNTGYTILSLSQNLETALFANRISYLGSVFLPLSMLMVLLDVTKTAYKKWLTVSLIALSSVVFLIAASPGILDIYYKDVSFAITNGVAALVKVYGPLHPLYLVYLLGYFSAMIVIILYAYAKKKIDTTTHAVILVIAVFVNIGVWLIEQLSHIEFEFLSVSYIISELFLLGANLVINENQKLKALVKQKEAEIQQTVSEKTEKNISAHTVSADSIERFLQGLNTLTPTESSIYEAYVAGSSSKEIMSMLNIKENTLKFHNKNIYGKLGVSSRKKLIEIHNSIKAAKK